MAKIGTIKKDSNTIYPKTVTNAVYDTVSNKPLNEAIRVDEENNRLIVYGAEHPYFVNLTSLAKPNQPYINENDSTAYVVTGDASFTVYCDERDVKLYYKLGEESSPTLIQTSNIGMLNQSKGVMKIASGFDYGDGNQTKSVSVTIYAAKNGIESDHKQQSVTIEPQAHSGELEVLNTTKYDTVAKYILTTSKSTGAQSFYKEGLGEWTEFTSKKEIEVRESKDAGYIQVKATHGIYKNSEVLSSSKVLLNAPMAYYGPSELDALTDEQQIKQLGEPQYLDTFGGETLTVTLMDPAYLWLCCTGTIKFDEIGNKEESNTGPNKIPFNDAITVGGYNCYRSSAQWVAGSHTVWIPS